MGRGRPFDDGGRNLLPLFRLTDDVNHATQGCSRGSDADEASQQAHRLREADDVRRSVLSVNDREVRTPLTSTNKHDGVRPTEHGTLERHPDTARQSRPTQLRLFDSEDKGRRLWLSTPPSYLVSPSTTMEREMVDHSTMPILRLFVETSTKGIRTTNYACQGKRQTTTPSSTVAEFYDSDHEEARTMKHSSGCRSGRHGTYGNKLRSRSDSDGDAKETLRTSCARRSRPSCVRSLSTGRHPVLTVSTSNLHQQR